MKPKYTEKLSSHIIIKEASPKLHKTQSWRYVVDSRDSVSVSKIRVEIVICHETPTIFQVS